MKLLKVTVMATALTLLSSAGCNNEQKTDGIAQSPNTTNVEKQEFTPEVLNQFKRVAGVQVSPDGKKILYSVNTIDIEKNKGNNDLWVMDVDGQNAKQITSTPNSEGNAVWFDNGNKIAFTYCDDSKEDAVTQVWVMDADGGNRKCVSQMEKDVEGFIISPDEKRIVIVSTVKYGKDIADYHPDMKESKARIIDDLMYRHWNEWTTEIPHPFVADFDGTNTSNVKDILEGTMFESPMRPWGGVEQLAWTADSKQLVYTCRKKVGKEYALSTNSDLYLYDAESGKTVKNLTEGMMGYDNNPIISKSGKLAWLSMEQDGYEADKNRIFLIDTIGGQKVDLTTNWDYSVDAIYWSPDEKYIYFTCPFQGTIPMFRMDIATQKVDTIAAGQFDYDGVAFAGNDNVITMRHSYLAPNEVYSVMQGQEPKQLTQTNAQLLASLKDVTCKKVMVPTTDGKQMTTWVLLPPDFDQNKKYPVIFFCEGGPQSPVSQFWSYRWNLRIMANHGYVVIAPNRRGLPGFGTEWNAEISGDYAGQCMKDYLSAVDFMKKEPYIDGEHIGCVGASFGGYSVYWLAGNHDNRFACFLAHAGIFDLRAQYLETEEMWFVNWDLGGAFWDKSNVIAQKSFSQADPKNYVQNWNKPIMVTTGENDFRISYTQTMQAFNAAKLLGLPTRMVLYPDECHWVQKPQNSIVWQREFFGWMDRWLMPDSEAAKKAATQTDSTKIDSTMTK
ncbi:MAG: S9 family peptidase [Bacteroidales bacterium]|nr:S9 family peptidase [Candidatus Sodaliphilus aphodohippi]